MENGLYAALQENFGFNLSNILFFHRIEKNELAFVIGMTNTYISLVCNSHKTPSLELICTLHDIFDFEIEDMAKPNDSDKTLEVAPTPGKALTIQECKDKVSPYIARRKEVLKL